MRSRAGAAPWAGLALLMLALLGACRADGRASAAASDDSVPPGFIQQRVGGHALAMPRDFHVNIFADDLAGVRLLALGPDGQVYASQTRAGRIVRLRDANGDGVADGASTFADGLNDPHGLAFRGDTLYVAETNRIVRFERPGERPVVIVPDLPSDGGHSTRTILLRDDHLYVSVGSSCNICGERDPRRAAVVRYNLDGTGEMLFATGLRNSVGLALHPETGEIWATNNDRDNLGDDLPPDRVNILREGRFYGWPQCYLPGQSNPEYRQASQWCRDVVGPAVRLPAHSAPLGLAFYTGTAFPEEYRGNLFIALHGSWNRSVPIGYEVVRVKVINGKPVGGWQPFITGWLEGRRGSVSRAAGSGWGRPVDVLVLADGALLISDDEQGRIYRVTYKPGT